MVRFQVSFQSMITQSLVAVLLISAQLILSACSIFGQGSEGEEHSRVFKASFDDVWRASQKALVLYPIRTNNSDTGLLQTDYVKGSKAFIPPGQEEPYSNGFRYRLNLRVLKGQKKGSYATKVVIEKKAEIQRDFFSQADPVESDGLEEEVILYRIERELQIERGIKKLDKK